MQAFGQRVRAQHPDRSFQVSISMRKGDRKPRGYDAAYLNNGFGQEDCLRTVDKRRAAAMAELPDASAAPTGPAPSSAA